MRVHHRVAQIDVAGGHVNLGAQGARAVRKFPGPHAREQVQVLLHRPVAVRALLARLGERAAVLADFVGAQVAHVGLALLDEPDGVLVQLLEVIGGVVPPVFPVEAQPADILLDGLDVLHLLLHRVGVVEAQVALAAEFRRDAEVNANGLGVADVQIPVRLRREAGVDAGVAARFQILHHGGPDEVHSLIGVAHRLVNVSSG